MRIAIPREVFSGETRVAATPDTVSRLLKLGFEVSVQAGAGSAADFPDSEYTEAGATIVENTEELIRSGDIIAKVRAPTDEELSWMKKGVVLIALLWPLQNEELVKKMSAAGITAISLDRIPRISRAQKMDVLSSMANISGYRAIIEAANQFPRFFGGQITAAGKTPPARVLIVGAGVAGLAAIGAARNLGAVVYAFDTRSAAREQVASMGAKFLEVEIEESGDGGGGYSKVMSKEFIDAEMALFREQAPKTDIVVTTALIPGRPAPKLWLKDMVELMKPGSVVVDLASSMGGNCELTKPGEVSMHNGVSIIGYTDLACRLPAHASQFFSRNIVHLLNDMVGEDGFQVDLENEVVRSATAVFNGEILEPPPPPEPSPPKPKVEEVEAPPVPAPETAVALSSNAQMGVGAAALAFVLAIGFGAPPEFITHLTVFILSCFVGYQVVWNVTAALHTPLMSVTNAISGVIIVGGILQAGRHNHEYAAPIGALAILFAAINISGGFLVTNRMLNMFRRKA